MRGRSELEMRVAENLRQLREEKTLRQKTMASAIGIKREAYSRLETGKRRLGLVEGHLAAIVLGVELKDLVERTPT